MTKDNKDLTVVDQFKEQLNIPKTETRIILETEDLYPDLAVKKSKLSPAARSKVVNHNKPYQSLNQETYGPCSYHNCKHKDKPFSLDIGIEGCKWWATSYDTSLPGYWERSPTGQYYSKERLWLDHMGNAYDANGLINQNNLYTVNTVGLRAMESDEFCGGAQNFIQTYTRRHEQGYPINETKILPSETTRATKWTIKTTVAATSLVFPEASPYIKVGGGVSWAVGEIVKAACDSNKAKHAWGMVSDAGRDIIIGDIIGQNVENAGRLIGEAMSGGSRELGRMFANEVEKWVSGVDVARDVGELVIHLAHLKETNYVSSCPICNS